VGAAIGPPQSAGGRAVPAPTAWPTPDLIVIDGGKGQLSAALEVLTTYNLQLTTPIIGLAKRIEEIFIPGKSDPIILSQDNPALQMLQRLRDEAHRFGITYHRKLRSKQAVRSALDDIPGIGPKTKKLLKAKFGTVANIRKTKFDDLAAVVGERMALSIQQSL
jgi:excinuclease ABC subunit C